MILTNDVFQILFNASIRLGAIVTDRNGQTYEIIHVYGNSAYLKEC